MAGKRIGTRIEETWQVTGKSLAYAEALGLEPHQILWVRNRFVRHFTGADCKAPVKKDWHRAWVNWIEGDLWRARKVRKEDVADAHRGQPDPNSQWHVRMAGWLRSGKKFWPVNAGPSPDEKGCYVPREVLKEFGIA